MNKSNLPSIPKGLDRGLTNFLSHMRQAVMSATAGSSSSSSGTTLSGSRLIGGTVSAVSTVSAGGSDGGTGFVAYTKPPPVEGLQAIVGFDGVMLSWRYPMDDNHSFVRVYRGTEDNVANAVSIGDSLQIMLFDTDVEPDTVYYYWVRSYNKGGLYGDFNAIEGVQVRTFSGVSFVEDKLKEAISESALFPELSKRIDKIEPLTGLQSTAESLEELIGLSNTGLNAVEILRKLVSTDIASYIDSYDGGDYCRSADGGTVDLAESECVAAGHEWVNLVGIKDRIDELLSEAEVLKSQIQADVSAINDDWSDAVDGKKVAIESHIDGLSESVKDVVSVDVQAITAQWSDPATGQKTQLESDINLMSGALKSQVMDDVAIISDTWTDPATGQKVSLSQYVADQISGVEGLVSSNVANITSEWSDPDTGQKVTLERYVAGSIQNFKDDVVSAGVSSLETSWSDPDTGQKVALEQYISDTIQSFKDQTISSGVSDLTTAWEDPVSGQKVAIEQYVANAIQDFKSQVVASGVSELTATWAGENGQKLSLEQYVADAIQDFQNQVISTGISDLTASWSDPVTGQKAEIESYVMQEAADFKAGTVDAGISSLTADWNDSESGTQVALSTYAQDQAADFKTGVVDIGISSLTTEWNDAYTGTYSVLRAYSEDQATNFKLGTVDAGITVLNTQWNAPDSGIQATLESYAIDQAADFKSGTVDDGIAVLTSQWSDSDSGISASISSYMQAQKAEFESGTVDAGISSLSTEWGGATSGIQASLSDYSKDQAADFKNGTVDAGIASLVTSWSDPDTGVKASLDQYIQDHAADFKAGTVDAGTEVLRVTWEGTDGTGGVKSELDQYIQQTSIDLKTGKVDADAEALRIVWEGADGNGGVKAEIDTAISGGYSLRHGISNSVDQSRMDWQGYDGASGIKASISESIEVATNLKSGIDSSVESKRVTWEGSDSNGGVKAAISTEIQQADNLKTGISSSIDSSKTTWEGSDGDSGIKAGITTELQSATDLKDGISSTVSAKSQAWSNTTDGISVQLNSVYGEAVSLKDQIAASRDSFHLAMYSGRCVDASGETLLGVDQAACLAPNEWIESVEQEVAKVSSFYADLDNQAVEEIIQFSANYTQAKADGLTEDLPATIIEHKNRIDSYGSEYSIRIDDGTGAVSGFGLINRSEPVEAGYTEIATPSSPFQYIWFLKIREKVYPYNVLGAYLFIYKMDGVDITSTDMETAQTGLDSISELFSVGETYHLSDAASSSNVTGDYVCVGLELQLSNEGLYIPVVYFNIGWGEYDPDVYEGVWSTASDSVPSFLHTIQLTITRPVEVSGDSEFAVLADSFLVAHGTEKTPIFVADGDGIALSGDVRVAGSVAIENLTSGELSKDATLSLVGYDDSNNSVGHVLLNGKGHIWAGTQDQDTLRTNGVLLDANGTLVFYRNSAASKALEQIEHLVGIQSNTVVYLQKYFSSPPIVTLSPHILPTYSQLHREQDQQYRLEAVRSDGSKGVEPDTERGSGYYKFMAKAQLELVGTDSIVAINADTDLQATDTLTLNALTSANATAADFFVNLRAIEGTGTSPQFYNKEVTVSIQFREADEVWSTPYDEMIVIGDSVGMVDETLTVPFPHAGLWEVQFTFSSISTGGVFTGGLSYSERVVEKLINDGNSFTDEEVEDTWDAHSTLLMSLPSPGHSSYEQVVKTEVLYDYGVMVDGYNVSSGFTWDTRYTDGSRVKLYADGQANSVWATSAVTSRLYDPRSDWSNPSSSESGSDELSYNGYITHMRLYSDGHKITDSGVNSGGSYYNTYYYFGSIKIHENAAVRYTVRQYDDYNSTNYLQAKIISAIYELSTSEVLIDGTLSVMAVSNST